MTTRQTHARVFTVRLGRDLADAVQAQTAEHGTPISEQIRRGLRMWLESRGALAPVTPAKPVTRRQPASRRAKEGTR
jgi:Arc/MetJ-type ribon-helix-helix transcriptional regulator